MKRKQLHQLIGFTILRICFALVIFALIVILFDIFSKGSSAISWEFITAMPRKGMTEGGIFPAIVGTFFVTIITALLSIPLGMGCAIYLNEYASNGKPSIAAGTSRFWHLYPTMHF